MTAATPTIRPFTRELRKLGFEYCYCTRHQGEKTTEFAKRDGNRTVRVQFWSRGLYRVTHADHLPLPNGRESVTETTPPTVFTTVAKMLAAVQAEWTRPSGLLRAE